MCCYTHNLYNNEKKKFHALWSLNTSILFFFHLKNVILFVCSSAGNCSLWYERMLPFEPATTKFSFEDALYETDSGQYRLLIEYGAPDVSAVTTLNVHGKITET